MNCKNYLNIIFALLTLSYLGNLSPVIWAQPADIAVAVFMDVKGENIQTGSIVTNSGQEIRTSNSKYDETLFGVVAENPSISIGKKNDTGNFPVATSGTVQVLVNNENGQSQKGRLHYFFVERGCWHEGKNSGPRDWNCA